MQGGLWARASTPVKVAIALGVVFLVIGGVLDFCALVGCSTGSGSSGSASDASGTDGGGLAEGSSSNCPASVPTQGEACGPAGLSCGYPGTTCSPCGPTANCTNGSWQIELPPCHAAFPPCPTTLPEAGTPCSWTCGGTWQCGYPSCTGPLDRMATCTGGMWSIAPVSPVCEAGTD
jgi:hypothetical protein